MLKQDRIAVSEVLPNREQRSGQQQRSRKDSLQGSSGGGKRIESAANPVQNDLLDSFANPRLLSTIGSVAEAEFHSLRRGDSLWQDLASGLGHIRGKQYRLHLQENRAASLQRKRHQQSNCRNNDAIARRMPKSGDLHRAIQREYRCGASTAYGSTVIELEDGKCFSSVEDAKGSHERLVHEPPTATKATEIPCIITAGRSSQKQQPQSGQGNAEDFAFRLRHPVEKVPSPVYRRHGEELASGDAATRLVQNDIQSGSGIHQDDEEQKICSKQSRRKQRAQEEGVAVPLYSPATIAKTSVTSLVTASPTVTASLAAGDANGNQEGKTETIRTTQSISSVSTSQHPRKRIGETAAITTAGLGSSLPVPTGQTAAAAAGQDLSPASVCCPVVLPRRPIPFVVADVKHYPSGCYPSVQWHYAVGSGDHRSQVVPATSINNGIPMLSPGNNYGQKMNLPATKDSKSGSTSNNSRLRRSPMKLQAQWVPTSPCGSRRPLVQVQLGTSPIGIPCTVKHPLGADKPVVALSSDATSGPAGGTCNGEDVEPRMPGPQHVCQVTQPTAVQGRSQSPTTAVLRPRSGCMDSAFPSSALMAANTPNTPTKQVAACRGGHIFYPGNTSCRYNFADESIPGGAGSARDSEKAWLNPSAEERRPSVKMLERVMCRSVGLKEILECRIGLPGEEESTSGRTEGGGVVLADSGKKDYGGGGGAFSFGSVPNMLRRSRGLGAGLRTSHDDFDGDFYSRPDSDAEDKTDCDDDSCSSNSTYGGGSNCCSSSNCGEAGCPEGRRSSGWRSGYRTATWGAQSFASGAVVGKSKLKNCDSEWSAEGVDDVECHSPSSGSVGFSCTRSSRRGVSFVPATSDVSPDSAS